MGADTPRVSAQRLRELIGRDSFVTRVEVLDTVGSTNDEIQRLAREGADEGTVVLAHGQSAGRGRLGRRWHSPAGLGLYVSVLLRPGGPPERMTRWTLAAAVAGCEACRRETGCAVEIKWPNDLLVGGRKLAGILVELRSRAGAVLELALGLGINVSHETGDFPPELAHSATSLRMACPRGIVLEPERLAATYLRLLGDLRTDLIRGAWTAVAQRWEALCPDARGVRVRVRRAARGSGEPVEFVGVTDGLDPSGALRVREASAAVELVRMAESIVRLES